jgi:two-component system LytT family response regulator
MKILILEDEPPARRSLKSALASFGLTDVIEASTVDEAARLIVEESLDLMFLDVELRGGQSGFDLLEMFIAENIPAIFVTAHPAHAVRAFDKQAADYLLKPINPMRLKQSIQRVLNKSKNENNFVKVFSKDESAFFYEGSKMIFVQVGDISVLESCDSYTKLVFKDGTSRVVDGTLKSVLQRIDRNVFLHANRRQAVNVDHVCRADTVNFYLLVTLANGQSVKLSRRQSAEFRRLKAI